MAQGPASYFSYCPFVFLCLPFHNSRYARAHEKIQKGAEEIKRVHRSSLHSVPLAIRLISKPTPRTFQVHTKKNQRIISCFPAWDRMREDWKQKRKQAPEPDGGGACVWILHLSLWPSVNALYHSNIEKNISQYVTINCNFYKCTFKMNFKAMNGNNTDDKNVTVSVKFFLKKCITYAIVKLPNR